MLGLKHIIRMSFWILVASSEEKVRRNQKQFSLFSVVSFGNLPCRGTSQDSIEEGTCFTVAECTAKNGHSIGNCAAGFGTCCQFSMDTCGSEVNQNCTYVTNPNFPATYTNTADCEYRINPVNTAICQLRLDFINFSLSKSDGECPDSLTITSPSTRDPFSLCGEIAGEHIYVDTARSSTATRLVFNTDGTAGSWRIKVMQLQCYDIAKPPNGCLQYFTGASGEFKSFSFGDGDTSMIRNSFYTICIRREQGFCQIDYAIQDVQGTTSAYQLSNDATAQNGDNARGEEAFLTLPNTDASAYSGQKFADGVAASSQHGTVRALGPEFRVGVTVMNAGNIATGFYLTYNQVAC